MLHRTSNDVVNSYPQERGRHPLDSTTANDAVDLWGKLKIEPAKVMENCIARAGWKTVSSLDFPKSYCGTILF